MAFPSPANAQEKWLYVSGLWDGSGSPVYTNYNNILGNSVGANQAAVDRLLGYCYAQGYTGVFLYNQGAYQSGATYTATGKNIIRAFIAQASALGISVGAVTSTSSNSLSAIIDYNVTTTLASQKFDCVVTENEWWWWSYNDANQGPCGEYAFVQMKANIVSKKPQLVAAGLPVYCYIGHCRDVGYTYSGIYNSNCGSVPRNGSTVVGSSEMDQLNGVVDKFMMHDYIINDYGNGGSSPSDGIPNYSYMRNRFNHFTIPDNDLLAIVSTEPEFSGPWCEGKLNYGAAVTSPRKNPITDGYNYIFHDLGLTNPPQQGTPKAYDLETNVNIQNNTNIVGIVNFKYGEMVSDTHQLNTENGTTFYVSAGSDQSTSTFPGNMALTGRFLDDYLPVGGGRSTVWSVVSGPAGGTFTNGSTLTPTFNWLLPGIYTLRLTASDSDVTLSDDMILTVTGSVSATLEVSISVNTEEACYGECTAILQATPSGGTGPYTYLWDTGDTTSTLSGVCDGSTHSVTVTDSLLETASDAYTYVSPATEIVLTLSTVNVTVNGGSDGEILATATGGSGTYRYSIDGGATWFPFVPGPGPYNFTGLTAGNYTVTVEDNVLFCPVTTADALITEPAAAPSIVLTNVVRPACNTTSNTGAIDLTVTGGTPGYTYAWTGPGLFVDPGTQDLSNLFSGTYTVIVTDAAAETSTQTIVVGVSSPVQNPTVTDVTCYGANDGSISVSVSEGTAPYTYFWSTGGTFNSIIDLQPGNYTLTVRDVNGCSSTVTYTITQPNLIVLSETHSSPSSTGTSDGWIAVTAVGGTGLYSYLWNTGDTTSSISALSSGSYTCTVSDENGCSQSITVYLFASDYLDMAAIRSKCCMADLTYKYIKGQGINPKVSNCLRSKIKYLKLATCLIDKYVNDLTCITEEQVWNLVENLNTLCGCCDCEYDDSLMNDVL